MKKLVIVILFFVSIQSFGQFFADGPEAICDEATFYAKKMVSLIPFQLDLVTASSWHYDISQFEVVDGGTGYSFVTLRKRSSATSLRSSVYFKKRVDGSTKYSTFASFHVNLSNSGVSPHSLSGTQLYPEMWNNFYIVKPSSADDYSWQVVAASASVQHSSGSSTFRVLPNQGTTSVTVKIRSYVGNCFGDWIIRNYSVRDKRDKTIDGVGLHPH